MAHEMETEQDNNILHDLLEAAANDKLTECLSRLGSKTDVSLLMDELVQILLGLKPQNVEAALKVVVALVQYDTNRFLLPLSLAFSRTMSTTTNVVSISPDLLQLWMQQITFTDQVAVHTNLLEAIAPAWRQQGPRLITPTLQRLVSIWKEQLSKSATSSSSIVVVRCATVWMTLLAQFGDVAFLIEPYSSQAQDLISNMIQLSTDPLLQLSTLDLFLEHLAPNVDAMTATTDVVSLPPAMQEWLSQPDGILSSVLNLCLPDPLLSATALQWLCWIVTLPRSNTDPSLQTIATSIFNHLRNEVGVTASETERLGVVQALSRLSLGTQSWLPEILQDAELRRCWWDVRRVSSPKLQAAILSSIALVLRSHDDAKQSLRLYALLGQDNSGGTPTTDWLYTKYVSSPMTELRIATYAVWTAVANIQGGIVAMTSSAELMPWFLRGSRETTVDARVAKFDLIQTFTQQATGFLSNSILSKLQKLLELGPHGVETAPFDVAME